MSRLGRLSLLAAVPIVVAACSTSIAGRPSIQPSTQRHLVQVWSFDEIAPESPVKVVDGIAVGYGADHGHLVLFGLDADSGKLVWRQNASTSRVTEGVAVQVSVVSGTVVYFGRYERYADEAARLIVADPRTGRTRGATRAMPWSRTPYACPHAPDRICCTAPGADGVSVEWSVDPDSGAMSAIGDRTSGGREIGTELLDPLVRKPELIERRVDGRRAWTRPVADIFGPGVSTDQSWLFDKYGDTYAGTLGAAGRFGPGKRTYVLDLARAYVSAGFRASDGRALWRSRGTYVACFGVLERDEPVPVRCSYHGMLTYRLAADHDHVQSKTIADLAVVIEGFDPATGSVRWRHDLGANEPMVSDGTVPIASDTGVVVRMGAGYQVLDLRTGRMQGARASYWCPHDRTFHAVPAAPDEYRVGEVVGACAADGGRTSGVPTSVPDAVGTAAPHGLRLVATGDAVIAYRQEG